MNNSDFTAYTIQEPSEGTIVAVSTPPGEGGIAVIRMSGSEAFNIHQKVWKGANTADFKSHTAHLGKICDENGCVLDEVVATVFRSPNSFTGEDVVEISCHGSKWLQREICNLLIRQGARAADAGEFTRRAFINGRIDLAQAEGVADLIAASSRAANRLAITQTSGAFSKVIGQLREKLITLASLLELELDFSEEDVEFANRTELQSLAAEIYNTVNRLASSYADGKVLKEGVPVVIAGAPNAGKSSLLNALLDDEKAIVTDIPGTTRDIIEDTRTIGGVLFRFIDTAGLRDTTDTVERIGIDRARQRMNQARVIVWMIDTTADVSAQYAEIMANIDELNHPQLTPDKTVVAPPYNLQSQSSVNLDIKHIIFFNKMDRVLIEPAAPEDLPTTEHNNNIHQKIYGSVLTGQGLPELEKALLSTVSPVETDTICVTNARHYAALREASASLQRVIALLAAESSATPTDTYLTTPDIIAHELRETTHHLGTITGAITTDTLLTTIFDRFCIGK